VFFLRGFWFYCTGLAGPGMELLFIKDSQVGGLWFEGTFGTHFGHFFVLFCVYCPGVTPGGLYIGKCPFLSRSVKLRCGGRDVEHGP
jgi:hypothetical protein